MTISNGCQIQRLTIFPPAQLASDVPLCLEIPYGEEECIIHFLTLEKSRGFQEKLEEHVFQQFLSDIRCIEYPIYFSCYNHIFSGDFLETCYANLFASFTIAMIE